jgi:DNA-binding NarL/FixJ family response regulator
MPAVLIVDENLLARQGLKHLLSHEHLGLVYGEAKTAEEAADFLGRRKWDIVVIDISIPGGFQILRELRRSFPDIRVLVLSPSANSKHVLRVRQLRASGYAAKNSPRAELLQAFRCVLAGKEYFPAVPDRHGMSSKAPHPLLSNRERDVLLACVAGKRVNQIAADLSLSSKTVSTYKRRILNKLQLTSVADLVRHAIQHKLV